MVIVVVVVSLVEEQVRFAEDFPVDKKLVAKGIDVCTVVDMAESIVADIVEDMGLEMTSDIAEVVVEEIAEDVNILSIPVVDKIVAAD